MILRSLEYMEMPQSKVVTLLFCSWQICRLSWSIGHRVQRTKIQPEMHVGTSSWRVPAIRLLRVAATGVSWTFQRTHWIRRG